MRLATFNLENLDAGPKSAVPLESRIAILRPQLERINADILCLQEINGQHVPGEKERRLCALDELLKETVYKDFHQVSTSMLNIHGVADVHNLVTLSRFPIIHNQDVFHSKVTPLHFKPSTENNTPNKDHTVKWDRPILVSTIELPSSQRLTVVNLHLRSPLAAPIAGQKVAPFVWKSVAGWAEGYFVATMKRIGQALETRLLLEQCMDEKPDKLIAVCGDFNADLNEMPLRIIIGSEEDTGNGELASRSMIPLDRTLPHEIRYSILHHGRQQMVDHILVSHSLSAHYRKIEIHNEALEDELIGYTKIDRSPNSFHAPVVAEFSFD